MAPAIAPLRAVYVYRAEKILSSLSDIVRLFYIYQQKLIHNFISFIQNHNFLIRVSRYFPFDTGLKGSIDLSECFKPMGSSSNINEKLTCTRVAPASTS